MEKVLDAESMIAWVCPISEQFFVAASSLCFARSTIGSYLTRSPRNTARTHGAQYCSSSIMTGEILRLNVRLAPNGCVFDVKWGCMRVSHVKITSVVPMADIQNTRRELRAIPGLTRR